MSTWYFYYPKRISFYPLDFRNPGLGGGEGSLVLLTEALASLGHHVVVFNCCYKPGIYNNVIWRMLWEIDHAPPPDIFVSVRFEEAIMPDIEAKIRLYWMVDNRSDGAVKFHETFGDRGGKIVVVSTTVRKILAERGVAKGVTEIPLIVEIEQFDLNIQRSLACLYCSVPNRGLDVLLSIWSLVRAQVSDAELWVTGGYQLWGYTNEEAEERYRTIVPKDIIVEGVKFLGVIPKEQLYKVQASCSLMVYPCRFPEMFCLAAAECSAAGLPIITSNRDALVERVIDGQTGYLIDGEIDSTETKTAFVEKTVDLLHDSSKRHQMGIKAKQLASKYDPVAVAKQWEILVYGDGNN